MFSSVLVLLLASCLFAYISYNMANLFWIKDKHHFAYKSHAPKQIPLVILTTFSLCFEVLRELQWVSYRMCQLVYKDTELQEYAGYCLQLETATMQPKVGQTSIAYYVLWVVIGLFPIWAFLALELPHDCFKCLGKDPDRNFSIY